MDDISLDKLLSGDLNKLPKLPKRVVRLFLSSTFTDMTLERNSLMERVYPKLKKYCRERHGLDFQVVDMRWGVRDEATDDHQTVNLCSREIENCQRVSLGPNFIALIGDKYGFRPLLNRIKSTEFRSIRRCLIESDINTDFLDTWYKEDLNAVPAEYLLQPISSILKNFTNKKEPELQMIDQRIWQAIQERLHELLLIGSSRLVKQGRMSENEQSLKYSISVTEREVIEGCLDLSETKQHCLVYVRSIVDLRDQLGNYFEELAQLNEVQQHHHQLEPTMANNGADNNSSGPDSRRDSQQRKASLKIGDDSIQLTTSGPQTAAERRLERQRRLIGKYIDLSSKGGTAWQVDERAQKALDELKEVKLGAKFPSNSRNLTHFKVHWNQQDGISVKSEEHKKYLDNLTDHFYQNVTRMIRSAVKSERSKVETRGLIGEVLQHSHYSLQVGSRVHGRSFELSLLRDYISTGSTRPADNSPLPERDRIETIKPMFLYGISGSGKTSILARVSTLAHDWVKQSSGRRRSSSAASTYQTNTAFGLVPTLRDQDQLGGRNKWSRRPCIIMRFCCTTPVSSSMVGMLTSICCQLQYNFYQFGPLNGLMEDKLVRGRDKTNSAFSTSGPSGVGASSSSDGKSRTSSTFDQLPYQRIPEDFVRLVYTFRQLLENCRHSLHKRRTFVIIIDSIERLSAPAECSVEAKFSWLTNLTTLPPNVRLIVSCSSSGTTRSELDDYLHLKRHFLRAHHVEHETNESDTSQMGSSSPSGGESTCEQSASESVSLSESPPPSRQSKVVSRFQLLRRLVLPAARIARASRGLISDSDTALLGGDLHNQKPGVRFTVSVAKKLPQDTSRAATSLERAPSSESLQGDHKSRWQQQPVCSGLLHIKPLGRELALSVLRRYLSESGRNLTQEQWAIVDRSLGHCSRPIFVKLAFGEIVNWKSYSTRSETRGLMFGSDWLVDFKPDRGIAPELERLSKRLAEVGGDPDDELKFQWQALAIEQQWLNFLDYKSGKSTSGQTDQQKRGAGTKDGGELVIRIGTSANSSNGSRRTCGGSSVSLAAAIGTTSGSLAGGALSASSSICHLSATIEEAICQLFSRIELKHGYLLIKHSLSYISAARNGICENELEDILSLDDIVLDDVFQYHLPPVRRIPPLLWTRIRNDLPDYLSERDADGIVLTWHHGQFKTVAEQRYLAQECQLTYVHSLMADYFLGKWADKAKPFRCTKQQVQMAAEQLESAIQKSMRRDSGDQNSKRQSSLSGAHVNRSGAAAGTTRLGSGSGAPGGRSGASFSLRNRMRSSGQHDRLQWLQAKAHRRVPQQPLYYETASTGGGQTAQNKSESSPSVKFAADEQIAEWAPSPTPRRARRYNLRKLTELPHHLLRSGRFLDLANETLFNYRWLSATLYALGLQSLFADLNEASRELELELAAKRQAPIEQQNGGGGGVEFEVDSFQADELATTGRDNLTAAVLSSLRDQLATLSSTLRLSASVVHCDPQQLAPQLLGRLSPARAKFKLADDELDEPNGPTSRLEISRKLALGATNFIDQLLEQCDRDGCSDCALLPIELCLQSADGLQLSSLEGHPFGVLSMCLASDQRHLLAASSKFLMWNISTGEIARDVEPKLEGALIKQLLLGSSNRFALAYTSNNLVLALEILTQQTSQLDLRQLINCVGGDERGRNEIVGMKLIDEREAKRSFVWMQSGLVVALKLLELNSNPTSSQQQASSASISVQYQLDLVKIVKDVGRILEVFIEQVGASSDLVLVSSSVQSSATDEISLTTIQIECDPQTGSIDSLKLWQWSPQAKLVVLGPSLRQLVLADQSGDLVLSRRRVKSWSRGKQLLNYQADRANDLGEHEANLLAIELEAGPKAVDLDEQLASLQLANISDELYGKLAKFESELDGDCDELQHSKQLAFSDHALEQFHSTREIGGLARTRRAKFLKLYYSNQISIVRLEKELNRESDYPRYCLTLPRDIRNVGLDLNQCQLTSRLVLRNNQSRLGSQTRPGVGADGHHLIVVATRKLLFYSLESEQLLKCIEAHSGRITSMLTIQTRADHHESGRRLALGSSALVTSSMDRTVKIWNLMNLDKASESVERLASVPGGGRQFESMRLNNQRPLAACLSRGQLSLWDWQESKVLTCFESMEDLAGGSGAQHQVTLADGQLDGNSKRRTGSEIKLCKFSKNGRYLALAGFNQTQRLAMVSLMAVSGPIVQSVGTIGAKLGAQNYTSSEVVLKLVASKTLPWDRCSVVKLKFLSQDSRLLVVVVGEGETETMNRNSTRSSAASAQGSADETKPTSGGNKVIGVLSLSVPEARQLYRIECELFPEYEQETNGNSAASRRRGSNLVQDRNWTANNLLVAVTCDQQYLVLVVAAASARHYESGGHNKGQTSRSPALNVYTVRDGRLAKSIDLGQLQGVKSGQRLRQTTVPRRSDNAANSLLISPTSSQTNEGLAGGTRRAGTSNSSQQQIAPVSVNQFNRLKAVGNRDCQSLVALMDERGLSCLIDVGARLLVAQLNSWSGAQSADGRFGLSRMFSSGRRAEDGGGESSSLTTAADGLKLLEMRNGRQVKCLLTRNQFEGLTSHGGGGQVKSIGVDGSGLASSEVDSLLSGFTKPNDAYVYLCQPRTRRLLLLRLRDGQLIANYRLASVPNRIKRSPDGLALVVGLDDGSLLALAIADPLSSDTLIRLSQYPSRQARDDGKAGGRKSGGRVGNPLESSATGNRVGQVQRDKI